MLEPFDDTPPETTLERAPADGSSSTIFEFSGTDDQTPPALLTFQCRIDSTSELDWEECQNPYNLLDHYTYADFQLAPGPHVFEVRAIDAFEPLFPDPATRSSRATSTRRRSATCGPRRRTRAPPGTGITSGPSGRTAETEATFEFFGTDNATPGAPGGLRVLGRRRAVRALQLARDGLARARHAHVPDPRGRHRRQPRPDARGAHVGDRVGAGRDDHLRPGGRILPGQQGPPAPSTEEQAVFTFTADQPDATFECAVDGADVRALHVPVPGVRGHRRRPRVRGPRRQRLRTVDGEPIVQEPADELRVARACSAPTRRARTRRSRPGRAPRRSTRSRRSSSAGTRQPHAAGADGVRVLARRPGYTSCTSPEQFTDMTHGPHELLVRARDVAGNVDATPARHTWTVALPPVVTIASGPDEVTESTSAKFVVLLERAGLDLQVLARRRDHRLHVAEVVLRTWPAASTCSPCWRPRPPGHTSLQWEEWEWIVGDTTAPITTFHSGPGRDDPRHARGVHVHGQRAERRRSRARSTARTSCPCSSPLVYPRLHAGEHRLEVRPPRRRCSTASACRSSPTTTRSRRSTSGRSSTRTRRTRRSTGARARRPPA